mgnify:CR=1 FL=1
MPPELAREMAALGLLGGPLPAAFGGEDWDALSLALCYEELGRADSSVRGLMTVHTSLVAQCVRQWGTDEQQARYLPRLARGEMVAGSTADSAIAEAAGVLSRVLCQDVERKESGRRAQPWIVVTTYAVVGHGLLGHHRWFADESQARIWERRHPVDSVHDVILDPRAKGSAYVPEDLAGIGNEWYWWPIAAVTVAIAAYGIYLMVQPVMLE